ncbi:lipid A biosynthesis lauroyl acyltransferase [Aquamicrobium segne]|uniref:Lipid A biosynthesis lauroyl acyltransferase n=1 Tax=Aquamicrobium segne TaxID=469547 RepID=A0ABW0H0X8_9HYPH
MASGSPSNWRRELKFRTSQRIRKIRHWLVARLAIGLMTVLRLLPADKALNFTDRMARRIGPLTSRHRLTLDNLAHAYPEKSPTELETIALDMWGNMARLGAEYIFLDKLFDLDPWSGKPGRIEVSPESIALFQRIAQEDKPHIIFTGHLGNFELLPVAAASFGMKVTALFRPPNNPYIADYIQSMRSSNMGALLPSLSGASFALASILDQGGNVGVLVDQKFTKGVETQFFSRICQSNPLLGMLARHYECDVYPARCIRLPNNRFRLEIEEKLDLPRGPNGNVDVRATTQLVTDVVERWVRENPGQWMWFHKRWQISKHRRRFRA